MILKIISRHPLMYAFFTDYCDIKTNFAKDVVFNLITFR